MTTQQRTQLQDPTWQRRLRLWWMDSAFGWRWAHFQTCIQSWYKATRAGFVLPKCRHLEPITAGSNPFHHDLYNMGTDLVRGWIAMHQGYDSKECPADLDYLILVNTRTGQRIRIDLMQVNERTNHGRIHI